MESLRGDNRINLQNNKQDIRFQVVDWTTSNEDINNNSDSEEEQNKFVDNKQYVIRAYGVTQKGTSVSLNIYGFPPHFYVNIPEGWKKLHLSKSKLNELSPFYCN